MQAQTSTLAANRSLRLRSVAAPLSQTAERAASSRAAPGRLVPASSQRHPSALSAVAAMRERLSRLEQEEVGEGEGGCTARRATSPTINMFFCPPLSRSRYLSCCGYISHLSASEPSGWKTRQTCSRRSKRTASLLQAWPPPPTATPASPRRGPRRRLGGLRLSTRTRRRLAARRLKRRRRRRRAFPLICDCRARRSRRRAALQLILPPTPPPATRCPPSPACPLLASSLQQILSRLGPSQTRPAKPPRLQPISLAPASQTRPARPPQPQLRRLRLRILHRLCLRCPLSTGQRPLRALLPPSRAAQAPASSHQSPPPSHRLLRPSRPRPLWAAYLQRAARPAATPMLTSTLHLLRLPVAPSLQHLLRPLAPPPPSSIPPCARARLSHPKRARLKPLSPPLPPPPCAPPPPPPPPPLQRPQLPLDA